MSQIPRVCSARWSFCYTFNLVLTWQKWSRIFTNLSHGDHRRNAWSVGDQKARASQPYQNSGTPSACPETNIKVSRRYYCIYYCAYNLVPTIATLQGRSGKKSSHIPPLLNLNRTAVFLFLNISLQNIEINSEKTVLFKD